MPSNSSAQWLASRVVKSLGLRARMRYDTIITSTTARADTCLWGTKPHAKRSRKGNIGGQSIFTATSSIHFKKVVQIKTLDGEIRQYLYNMCLPFEPGILFLPLQLIETADRRLREFEKSHKLERIWKTGDLRMLSLIQ
jgi:hypothetical protein